MRLVSEPYVKQQVVRWLTSHRWGHIDYKEEGEHGVDIRARHVDYARYYLIECKGDPDPSTVKHPQANRDVRFMTALGQILSRMDTVAGYYYGIAVPRSYESLVYNRVPWQVCKRLQLRFLLVDGNGSVEELTWRAIRVGRPATEDEPKAERGNTHRKEKESGWDIMKRQLPTSQAVDARLREAFKAGRSEGYIRTLTALKGYWEKRGR